MSNLDLGARQIDGVWTGTEWTPIGSSKTIDFKGTFEGNNHYIVGIYLKQERDFVGIFGYSTNTIKNLTIIDGYIEADGRCVGGIVGQTASTGIIKNCKNTGNVIGYGERVGGITGGNVTGQAVETNINACVNTGVVEGKNDVGGIIGCVTHREGINDIVLTNCYNTGLIKGQEDIGGIIGQLSGPYGGGKVQSCFNIKDVEGISNSASIIGYCVSLTENTIEKCYYLSGTSEIGITGITDTENIVEEKIESEMKTQELVGKLNLLTNTGAWVGKDGQYPKLSWE